MLILKYDSSTDLYGRHNHEFNIYPTCFGQAWAVIGRKKKEHVTHKELFAYVQQFKLLMLQFKTRHTVCGHVAFTQVYTDKRSCKECACKSNPDHATKGGNTDMDPLNLKRQKAGLL